jgi:hypothetical protein
MRLMIVGIVLATFTPSIPMAFVQGPTHDQNLKTCLSGKYPFLCDHGALNTEQLKETRAAENREICRTGSYSFLCDRSKLSPTESESVERNQNLNECLSGHHPASCNYSLLSPDELAQVRDAERVARSTNTSLPSNNRPTTEWLSRMVIFLIIGVLIGLLVLLITRFRMRGSSSRSPWRSRYEPEFVSFQPLFGTGRYRVTSVLGSGGMGTVFKALDRQGREVAIKMIGGGQLRGTALKRENNSVISRVNLIREAHLAAKLRHPNIVQILDIGQHKGDLYIVMELLVGVSLDRYARSHSVKAPEAARILAQLCDGLDYAHSHGIIHRDVKPANAFITHDGTVKVLDFGLALQPGKDQSLRSLAGTPSYMSPEQFRGQDLDRRADIWSAGVTLFELLTNTLPFQGRSMAELRSNVLDSPTPKLPFGGPFAEELNNALAKALARDREERYVSAGEFAADLRALLRDLPQAVGESNQFALSWNADPYAYAPIRLGFQAEISGPVYTPPASLKKSYLDALRRRKFPIWRFVAGVFILNIVIGESVLDTSNIVSLVILSALLIVVPWAILNIAMAPPFFRCRSCRRRMRSVCAWNRPIRVAERERFCEQDCIAALMAGIWEEAVKLLWIHTSDEISLRRHRLEFFECNKCSDQRAYLTREGLSNQGWEIVTIREAYRFGAPGNARRFLAKTESARRRISPPSDAVLEKVTPRADVHDKTTL